MPARILPTGLGNGYMNGDANPKPPKQQTSVLTTCISLASLFDFEKTGFVSKENWQKGMTTLMLEELGTDPKIWSQLLDIHGSKDMSSKGQLDVNKLSDVVPIDPRVSVLLNAIVKGLVGTRDFVARTLRKEDKDYSLKRNRTILNVRRRIMEPCLRAWRELLRDNKKLFKRSANYARYYVHFRAWRQWRWAVELCKHELVEKKKEDRKMRRIKGAALRMHNAKLSVGFNSWMDAWIERRKYLKAIKRFANRPLSMAFNALVAMRERGVFLRKLARRSLNYDLSKGWNSWHSYLDDLVEQARQMRVMDAVVRRYLNRGLSRAINQWTLLWRERQQLKRLVRRMGPDGGVSKAWRQWIDLRDEQAFLRGCIGRFAKHGMSKAYNRWLEMLDERQLLHRYAKRAFRVDVARGWNAWAELVAQARSVQRTVTKYSTRMLRHAELRCWNHWFGLLVEARRLRSYGRRMQQLNVSRAWNTWIEYLYDRDRLRGIMAKAVNGPMHRAWSSWLDAIADIEKMRSVLQRCIDGRPAKAFNRWVAAFDEGCRLRDFGSKMVNHQLLRAWNQWATFGSQWRMLKAFAARIVHDGLVRAINTWLDMRHDRTRLQAFAFRLMNRNVTRALTTWYARADEIRRMRGAVARGADGRLSAAWNTWTGLCNDVARMDFFAGRMLQQEQLRAWNKWYALLEEYWRLQKIMRRMKNMGLAHAFDHWLNTLETKEVYSKRERGYMRMQHLKKLARAWRAWRTSAASQASRKRMNETFKFSKPTEEDVHDEAVDWRASLLRGRTRGGVGL